MFIPSTRSDESTETEAFTLHTDLPEVHKGLMFRTGRESRHPGRREGGTPWTFAVGEVDSNILL
jgi:hypothetical protein